MYYSYRLTERLGYRHVSDLLTEMTSAELSGWFEYLRLDDEVRAHWLTHAIVRAFRGDTTQQVAQVDEDGEEIIDTTQPEFAEKFKGFINQPAGRPQRNIHGSTQILMG